MLLFQRYVLHMGKAIDDSVDGNIKTMVAQMGGHMAQTTPETQAQLAAYFRFLLSPDGKAFLSLTSAATAAVFMIVLASLGGALGAWRFAARRRPDRSFLTSVSSAALAPPAIDSYHPPRAL